MTTTDKFNFIKSSRKIDPNKNCPFCVLPTMVAVIFLAVKEPPFLDLYFPV